MRNSKIYCQINTDRKGDKSFGCDEFLDQRIFVGSSAINCYEIARIEVNNFVGTDSSSFMLVVNGKIIKKVNFDFKTKEFTEVK